MARKLPHRWTRNRDQHVRAYRGEHRRARHARFHAIGAGVAAVVFFVALGVVLVFAIWALS